jgi:hypothetical protein
LYLRHNVSCFDCLNLSLTNHIHRFNAVQFSIISLQGSSWSSHTAFVGFLVKTPDRYSIIKNWQSRKPEKLELSKVREDVKLS